MSKGRGFTIIELMVATVVFSLVLLVSMAGVMQISRMYFRGVTQVRTQETARVILDEISESLRFSGTGLSLQPAADLVTGPEVPAVSGADDTNFFCLGSKRYTYAVDRQFKESPNAADGKQKRHVFWVDQPDICSAPADLTQSVPSPNGRELLSENMRISRLDIIPEPSLVSGFVVDEAYTIHLTIAYGDDNTQQSGPLVTRNGQRTCENPNIGIIGSYCAVSAISITVERRL